MTNRHWSISSRTGYEQQALHLRVKEAIAIISSILAIGIMVAGIGILSRMM